MKIIVDENIPYGLDAFGTLGDVTLAHGRKITRELLKDADALIIRSITKVNAALLDATSIRFVGTCTIGEDHVDKTYLKERGVCFTSAPGCNANSVGEYIAAALTVLAAKHQFRLEDKTLGIIGVGTVGAKVYQKATALGMTCMLNDPPRADASGDPIFRPLTDLLECDIITAHTPLNKSGNYPTWHLMDKEFFQCVKQGIIIINSSRGAVCDNAALEEALRVKHVRGAVLDVWENEPEPNPVLLQMTDIATPHIAGYSFDGKVNGTRQVYEALCSFLDTSPTWDPQHVLPPADVPEITVNPDTSDPVADAVKRVYDIMQDDARMRGMLEKDQENRGAYFDGLRKNYPVRREFFNTTIVMTRDDARFQNKISGIGFNVK